MGGVNRATGTFWILVAFVAGKIRTKWGAAIILWRAQKQ